MITSQLQRHAASYGHRGHLMSVRFIGKTIVLPGRSFLWCRKKETVHKGGSYSFQIPKLFQPWKSEYLKGCWNNWLVAQLLSGCDSQSYSHSRLSHLNSLFPPPVLLLVPLHLSMSSFLFLPNNLDLQHCQSPPKTQCWGWACGRGGGRGMEQGPSGSAASHPAERRLGALLLLLFASP